MKKKLIKFKQGEYIYYLVSLTLKELIKNSFVLTFETNSNDGYQRKPIFSHYSKISKLFEKDQLPSLPTSILLAVDKTFCDYNFKNDEFDFDGNMNMPNFRIVDGQHRLEGIKYFLSKDISPFKKEKIENMEFPVVIMVIEDNKRIIEVKSFLDINSKSKPLKKDLALLALYRYSRNNKSNDILDEKNRTNDLMEIGIAITYKLNEDENFHIWKNAFNYDTAQDDRGIVGLKSFIESVVPFYVNDWNRDLDIKDIDDTIPTRIIENFIEPVWSFLYSHWGECFDAKGLDDGENITYFNTDYMLQKTLGVKVIHRVLQYAYEQGKDNDFISIFKEKIKKSGIRSEDWLRGGEFKGVSSEAGFSYLAKKIFYGEE